MTDLNFTDDLPPDGVLGQFLGMDEDGRAFIVKWHPEGWVATGFEADNVYGFRPVCMWGSGVSGRIVRTAPLPAMGH